MSGQDIGDERDLLTTILERLVAVTERPVWPRFRPAAMPLAIAMHDAGSTWRAVPDATADADTDDPASTVRVAGSLPMVRFGGIDLRIVANSGADFDGVRTATVIVPAGALAKGVEAVRERYTGLAVHELFHVHQRAEGFAPGGNEAVLLTAPWDDPERLALARAEARALRRAVETAEDDAARAAMREAIALRRERAARLDADELAYVRDVEVMEGTASYAEVRSRRDGERGHRWVDQSPLDLRRRCYDTGLAWCLLLDRFGPGDWKDIVAAGASSDREHLDALAAPLDREDTGGPPDGWRELLPAARDDITREQSRREARLAALRSPDRARVVVRAASGGDLAVAGFDPLNLLVVDAATVLHERYLALVAGDAQLTVVDRPAITTAAGDHPLFAGLREAEIAGDEGEARVWPDAQVRIEGDHAVREGEDGTVEIVLGMAG